MLEKKKIDVIVIVVFYVRDLPTFVMVRDDGEGARCTRCYINARRRNSRRGANNYVVNSELAIS